MKLDRTRASQAFSEYVSAFNPEDPKIALKIDHTWRVAELADRIAHSLLEPTGNPSLEPAESPSSEQAGDSFIHSEDDTDLAWLLGLLHDVGRFEQVRQYGTFNDHASVSHAALGAQVLFDGFRGAEPTIRDYVDDSSEDELIHSAVALHSEWHLPEDLDTRTRFFCDLLRDADKVDILKVNCVNSVESIYGFSRKTLLESKLSEEAQSWFWRHSTIPWAARHYPADIMLGHVCFAWDLCFAESKRALVEQGYVFQMMERSFVRPEVRAAFARMEEELKEALAP